MHTGEVAAASAEDIPLLHQAVEVSAVAVHFPRLARAGSTAFAAVSITLVAVIMAVTAIIAGDTMALDLELVSTRPTAMLFRFAIA